LEKRTLNGRVFKAAVFIQKPEYIHQNPVNAVLCKYAEEYKYSSAAFYDNGNDLFNILTHYKG